VLEWETPLDNKLALKRKSHIQIVFSKQKMLIELSCILTLIKFIRQEPSF